MASAAAWSSISPIPFPRVTQIDIEATVPNSLSNVVAICASGAHNLVLKANGRVTAWGNHSARPADVPSRLSNVVAIAAGTPQNLVLIHQPGLPAPRLDLSRGMSGPELRAHGTPGISYQLLRASHLPGPWLPSDPVTFVQDSQLLREPDSSQPMQFFRLLRK